MDEFEQRSREVARAILEQHGWKRPMTAELKEMREVVDLPYTECKRYLIEEWQNVRVPLLEEEIKQLQELVRIMAYCMQYERECDECKMNGADGNIAEPVGCVGLLCRLRELGVEA